MAPGNLEVHYRKIHSEFYENKFEASEHESLPKKVFVKESVKKRPKKLIFKDIKKPKIFFPCGICGNSFISSLRYQKHLNDLHGVREHEILSNNERIDASLKQDVQQKTKNIPCTTCGKMFANLNTCKTHEKIHSGLRYVCDLCGSSFSMKVSIHLISSQE